MIYAGEKNIIVVAYGGGTNSTALLVGLHERNIRPDLILFADTGAERPSTYDHVKQVSDWCESVGFPRIITVQSTDKNGNSYTLEQKCLEGKMLPSIAYGFKSCSDKHKRRPQDKFVASWPPAIEAWDKQKQVTKLIGYDAGEERRAKIMEEPRYRYEYPLIEWGWDRDDCIAAIKRARINQPGKSACFFCPSSKKQEILLLQRENPDLLDRALAIEANAELTSIKGLGRNYAWRDLIRATNSQMDLFSDAGREIPCGCFDGGEE